MLLSVKVLQLLFGVLHQLKIIENIRHSWVITENDEFHSKMGNKRRISNVLSLIQSLEGEKRYKLARMLEKDHQTMKYFGFPVFVGLMLEGSDPKVLAESDHQIHSPTQDLLQKLRSVSLFLLYQPYVIILASVAIVAFLYVLTTQLGITLVELSIGALVIYVITEQKIGDLRFICDLLLNDEKSEELVGMIDWHRFNVKPLISHVRKKILFFFLLCVSLIFMTINLSFTINVLTLVFVLVLSYMFFVLALPLSLNNPLFIFVYMFFVLVLLIGLFVIISRLNVHLFQFKRRK